jgi:hypothetical protein
MMFWEVPAAEVWIVLDHYAENAEKSDDLFEQAIGWYLRRLADEWVADHE